MNRFNGFQLTIRYFGRLFSSTPTLPTAMGMVTEVVVLDPFPVVGTAPLPDEGPIPGSKRPSPESRRRDPPWGPGGDRSIIDGHTAFIFTRTLTCGLTSHKSLAFSFIHFALSTALCFSLTCVHFCGHCLSLSFILRMCTASLMGLSQSLTHPFGLIFQSTDTLKLL